MIGAIVVVNEVDAQRWFPQLLPELTRFGVKVAWVLDHCSDATRATVEAHPGTVGVSTHERDGELFLERWRQEGLAPLRAVGCNWAMLWDADDTFTHHAPGRIRAALEGETRGSAYVRRISIQREHGVDYVRTDGPFDPRKGGSQVNRVILFNLAYELRWMDNITHGAYTFKDGVHTQEVAQVEAYSVHWGLMDRELRESHKTRWDVNYPAACGRNPYGLWNYVLDPANTPRLYPLKSWLRTHPDQ